MKNSVYVKQLGRWSEACRSLTEFIKQCKTNNDGDQFIELIRHIEYHQQTALFAILPFPLLEWCLKVKIDHGMSEELIRDMLIDITSCEVEEIPLSHLIDCDTILFSLQN